jgi:hypothetical protein
MPHHAATQVPRVLCFIENPTALQHLVRSRALENAPDLPQFHFGVVVPPSLQPAPADVARLAGVEFFTLNLHASRMKDLAGRTLRKIIHIISRDLQTVSHPDATLGQDRLFISRKRGKSLKWRLMYARVLKALGLRWRHITWLAQRLGSYPDIANLLDQFKPDMVVYFNILIGQLDCLREVKRRRIPLILDIPNWDQASSKGPMTVWPDQALVWTDFIKNDFCRIQDFPLNRVRNIGVLQFDCYHTGVPPLSREEFCRIHGIDPAAKIILYAYGQPPGIKAAEPFIDDLLEVIGDNKLGYPCHLIFRASPRVPFPPGLKGRQGVTVQYPLGHDSADGLGWVPAANEDHMRMSTLTHSDLVVNVFSTMCLDGLCMGKPVINFGYACGEPEDKPNRMERFFTYTHLLPVMRSQGTWVPRNKEEFRAAVIEALENPEDRAEVGRELYEEICGQADGLTWRRWKTALATIWEEHAAPYNSHHSQAGCRSAR